MKKYKGIFTAVMFLHLSVILFTGGGLCHGDPPVWLRAGGTHSTGMHSCFSKFPETQAVKQ